MLVNSLIFKGKGEELESMLFYIEEHTQHGFNKLFWDLVGERFEGWDTVLGLFDKKELSKIVYENKENFNINDYVFYIEDGKITSKSYNEYYSNIESNGTEILKQFLQVLEIYDKKIFNNIKTMEDIYRFTRNYN